MIVTTFLLLCLLSAPPDAPTNVAFSPTLAKALTQEAVRLEILDQREVRYVLMRAEDFQADLNLIRRRVQSLADAPHLDTAPMLSREEITELIGVNRAYHRHLSVRQAVELHHYWEIKDLLGTTDQLFNTLDAARDAQCLYYYVTARRQALRKLRDAIGPEAFYAGRLPFPIPVCTSEED